MSALPMSSRLAAMTLARWADSKNHNGRFTENPQSHSLALDATDPTWTYAVCDFMEEVLEDAARHGKTVASVSATTGRADRISATTDSYCSMRFIMPSKEKIEDLSELVHDFADKVGLDIENTEWGWYSPYMTAVVFRWIPFLRHADIEQLIEDIDLQSAALAVSAGVPVEDVLC